MQNRTTKLVLATLISALILTATLFGQDVTAEATAQNTSLLGLLKQGGWAMYPLGLTALFMFCLLYTSDAADD